MGFIGIAIWKHASVHGTVQLEILSVHASSSDLREYCFNLNEWLALVLSKI